MEAKFKPLEQRTTDISELLLLNKEAPCSGDELKREVAVSRLS